MDYDIYKAAAIIIRDKQLLVTRTKGKEIFVAPGGKLEAGETLEQALRRELAEELQIKIKPDGMELFGTYFAQAAYAPDSRLRMDTFMVKQWEGGISPSREIDEMAWVTAANPRKLPIGSIFEHEVIPRLKAAGLID